MSILCRQVSLVELSTSARAHRCRWQSGTETAVVTYLGKPLGVIVPLEIFASLSTEIVSKMPLRELQPWLFHNQHGWLDGLMDGLKLTWHTREVLGFVHPRHSIQLPLPVIQLRKDFGRQHRQRRQHSTGQHR